MTETGSQSEPDLTWPALLAKWTQFAQASAGLPKSGPGASWRAAIPSIIGLQAVIHALADLGSLRAADRPSARTLAAAVVTQHETVLRSLWPQVPAPIGELLHDAHAAVHVAGQAIAPPQPGGGTPRMDYH